MTGRRSRWLAALLTGLVLWSGVAVAGPIPSKPADDHTRGSRETDLATVQDILARGEVARVLADRGLTADEIDHRLARLSDEDLRSLASNLEQIRAAGTEEVPEYIWWLLGGLLGVLILAALL